MSLFELAAVQQSNFKSIRQLVFCQERAATCNDDTSKHHCDPRLEFLSCSRRSHCFWFRPFFNRFQHSQLSKFSEPINLQRHNHTRSPPSSFSFDDVLYRLCIV
ncbi:hypothetical protein IAS59_004576 [Cryptococcus gattii]